MGKIVEADASIIQLHSHGESPALDPDYNWNQILYIVIKPGKT